VGQHAPAWFLARNCGGTTVREVFVPEGKALFFPLLNALRVQSPMDPPYIIGQSLANGFILSNASFSLRSLRSVRLNCSV